MHINGLRSTTALSVEASPQAPDRHFLTRTVPTWKPAIPDLCSYVLAPSSFIQVVNYLFFHSLRLSSGYISRRLSHVLLAQTYRPTVAKRGSSVSFSNVFKPYRSFPGHLLRVRHSTTSLLYWSGLGSPWRSCFCAALPTFFPSLSAGPRVFSGELVFPRGKPCQKCMSLLGRCRCALTR
jgi:hypothetical protein